MYKRLKITALLIFLTILILGYVQHKKEQTQTETQNLFTDDQISKDGQTAYALNSGVVGEKTQTYIKYLLVAKDDTPDNIGLLNGLEDQVLIVVKHAQLAAQATDVSEIKKHAQYIFNALQGEKGFDYNPIVGDLSDGYGIYNYVSEAEKYTSFIASSTDATESTKTYSIYILTALNNIELWLTGGINELFHIYFLDLTVTELQTRTNNALNWFQKVEEEVKVVFQYAQLMK